MSSGLKPFVSGLLIGSMLVFSTASLAEPIKQYILIKAEYPIYVEGEKYQNPDLPILNYMGGHTYIPLRAVANMLGASVEWNEGLNQVEIFYRPALEESEAFRQIEVTGTSGSYTVTGEARVYEATMQYAISDGHAYLLEGFETISGGAPDWIPFTLYLNLRQSQLPLNGTLTLELFEENAEDGSKINMVIIPLETFGNQS